MRKKILKKLTIAIGILLVILIVIIIGRRVAKVQVVPVEGARSPEFGFAGPTNPPDDFNKIVEVGAGYIREGRMWHTIETSDNVFDFSNIDDSYDLLKNTYNLGLAFRIKMRESWATSCDTTNITCPDYFETCPNESADCPPKDLGNWNQNYGYSQLLFDYIYKLLEHANTSGRPIEYIVVGNEASTLTFWHGTADDYFKVRGTIFKAVQDANRDFSANTKVVDNGFAGLGYSHIREEVCSGDQDRISYAQEFALRYFSRRFTEEQMQDFINDFNLPEYCANPERGQEIVKEAFKVDTNLGEASFDYMAYHFYEPWNTQEEVIGWVKGEMGRNGYQKPIMQTEGGYRDYLRSLNDPSLVDEIRQDVTNDIPKLHVVAFANGVKKWLWLPFTERYDAEYYGPEYSGLISPVPELLELPAFTSYKITAEKLGGFSKVEKIKFGNPYVYKFTVDDRPIYVLWNSNNSTYNLSSELSGDVKVTRVDGSSETVASSSIPISESPIFAEPAGMYLTKEVDKYQASPGDILTYTLQYINGETSAINVKIEDPVPTGTFYVNGSASNGGVFDGTKIIWSIGNVAASGRGDVTFRVRAE